MSIKDNLSLIALKDLPGRFFIDRKTEKEKTKAIFDRMKVKAPSMDSMVVNLSGGNQQKVVLGKWLAKNPSDMPELVSISDRVLVLSSGTITGEFSKDEVTQTNIMKAAIAEKRGCEDETK